MATATELRKRFRTLLAAPEVVVAPGCSDPITSRVVELAGFPAIHASGSVAHRTSGFADSGILTMTEMVDRITAITDSVDIPVIGDADTGFGNVVNVARTIKHYERAGAAAVHIEDQETPKRPLHQGYSGGTISRTEMVNKIRAAVDARTDENLVIVARCEVKGDFKELTERLVACVEAGADAVWLSARDKPEIEAFRKAVGKAPAMGVLPRGMTVKEYGEAGASCAVIPGALQIAALCAQWSLLEELRETGVAETYLGKLPGIDKMRQFYMQQGNDELDRINSQFGSI